LFLKGNGGILYPPKVLPAEAYDLELALHLCPTADDVWFKAMSLLAGVRVAQVTDAPFDPPTIRRVQRQTLSTQNVWTGENDRQLARVLDHFDLWEQLAS
jgi:hypothetical protein